MAFTPRSDDEAAAAMTQLVDGTLSDAERRELEAWAHSTPELARALDAQTQVKHELATRGPQPPDRLLDAINDRVAQRRDGSAAARGRTPAGPAIRRRPGATRWRTAGWRPAIGLGALAAVAAIVVVVVTTAGSTAPVTTGSTAPGTAGSTAPVTTGSTAPGITSAARLAFVPADEPAPSVASTHYLDVSYHGVTFPNYERLGATATGQLRNHIDGRSALTVFYRLEGGQRLSYTVFSGTPLPFPPAAQLHSFEGVPLRSYRTDGLSVVTLVRHGRTCVLAAPASKPTVLALAAEPVLTAGASA